jgi:hypothetical protein
LPALQPAPEAWCLSATGANVTLRGKLHMLALAVVLCGPALAAQRFSERRWSVYEWEMQNPAVDPPDAWEKTEFAFARLRYQSPGRGYRGSWGTDSNKAERVFVQGVRRLTRIHTRSVEEIVDVQSDGMFDWPWLYAVEVGYWGFSDSQAKRLRDYLDRGGFLMVDDFHGSWEWNAFMAGLRKVFPDRQVVDIPDDDPIFHTIYDLQQRWQVPGRGAAYSGVTYQRDGVTPRWRAIYDDKGRIQVAICHNMDLGDAWEWADDPYYPERFGALAYRIGTNYVVYAMSH